MYRSKTPLEKGEVYSWRRGCLKVHSSWNISHPRSMRDEKEEEYTMNEEPCMILEVETPKGWFCLDATRRFNTLGRLLNHAPPRKATAKPTKPLFIKGKWRVGVVAARDLQMGEELTWDYGCPPQGQQWLMRYSKVCKILLLK